MFEPIGGEINRFSAPTHSRIGRYLKLKLAAFEKIISLFSDLIKHSSESDELEGIVGQWHYLEFRRQNA